MQYGVDPYCCISSTYMQINILNVLIMNKIFQGVQGFKYFVHAHTYTYTHNTHTHTHMYTQHNTTHTQIKIFDGKIFKDWPGL